jgi:predicted DNA-binding helix-hairpin-helix protein
MRDISTDDLVQTLIIKTEAHERARCVYAVHPTAQNAKAVTARARDQKNALRALAIHIKDCVRMMQSMRTVKMPPGYVNLRGKIPQRTINALKNAQIYQPESCTVEELLRIPGVGVQGLASIAQRAYSPHTTPINWPELHRVD